MHSITPSASIRTPYVGPETFTQSQANLFFGREREARDLLSRVLSERLVLFYAQSGAGKSSLINARLIPSLREMGFASMPVVRVGGEVPAGVERVDNIYLFNLMLGIDRSNGPASRFARLGLVDFLHGLVSDDGEHFVFNEGVVSVPEMPDNSNQPVTPYVLIIDQFEEIITTHPGRWQERETFFRQLDEAMQRDPNLWVVLTLREDYVPSIEPYAPLLGDRMRARFYMERMGVDAALESVRRPAEVGGRPFAPGVAEKLVDNLRQVRVPGQQASVPGQYVEPVQLQVVCYQMWEKILHRSAGPITEADLQEAGDIDQALGQFYEDALQAVVNDPALGVSERQIRTWIDTQLITEKFTRGTAFQGEESTAGLDNRVVDLLESRRLVRKEVRAGGAWIELIHDRFVEPIRWNNRVWSSEHLSPLQRQATLWDEQKRSSGLLLSGDALAAAEDWTQMNKILEPHEQAFLDACRAAREDVIREKRQSRRIRMLGIVSSIVAVLAIIASIVAWRTMLQAELYRQAEEQSNQRAFSNEMLARHAANEAERQTIEAERQRRLAETRIKNVTQMIEDLGAERLINLVIDFQSAGDVDGANSLLQSAYILNPELIEDYN